jgi:hypothetical protein
LKRRKDADAPWGDYASGVMHEWPDEGLDLEAVALSAVGNGHCALVILLVANVTPENVHESKSCFSSRWAATLADQIVWWGLGKGANSRQMKA